MNFQNSFTNSCSNDTSATALQHFEMNGNTETDAVPYTKQTAEATDVAICNREKLSFETSNISQVEQQSVEKRRPVLRFVLRPILILMRAFGFYYNDSSGLKKLGVSRCSTRFWKCYAFFVNAILVAYFLRAIAGLWYVDDSNGYYVLGVHITFYGKTVSQTLYILYLCHQEILWNFINELESFLDKIMTCRCRIVENTFVRKLRVWLVIFIFFMLLCTTSNIVINFIPNEELEQLRKFSLLPINSTAPVVYVFKTLLDMLTLAGWLLPAFFCGTLIHSVHFTLNEYYRYLESQRQKGICVRAHVREIRLQFLELSRLCTNLDGMMSVLMMISYLGDVCLICLILRIGIYTIAGVYGKVIIFSWIIAPIFTLLFLSRKSSQLYDKGQEMFSIVQFFNTGGVTLPVKMEFDMLLFHLNTEPVVMTIWKMIPLYRSIIISIFVSIITYFALIISLA